MPSWEAVECLKAGALAWRKYCSSTPGRIDLKMVDLSNADLSGYVFENCDLSGANLESANLDNSTMMHCVARSAIFANCSIVDATITGNDFRQSDFTDVVVRDSTVHDCDFGSAEIERSVIINSQYSRVNLSNARLDFLKVVSCEFREIEIKTVTAVSVVARDLLLKNCRMTDFNLVESQWQNCRIISSELRECDISFGSWQGVSICRSHIEKLVCTATVENINMSESEIIGTDLSSLSLASAVMFSSTLVDCKLPVQTGSTSWTGKHTPSAHLLQQSVQDLKGIPPLLRREIADAQFLRDKIRSVTKLRQKLMLRLWGATCKFGQSLSRLMLWSLILVTLHTLTFLASRGEIVLGGRFDPNRALIALRTIAGYFIGINPELDEVSGELTSTVITSSRIIGLVLFGLFISVGANRLGKLSAE